MKRYGLRMQLPADDPMRAAHLLGADWEASRWYDTAAERDAALAGLKREGIYYRRGDLQSVLVEPVDR